MDGPAVGHRAWSVDRPAPTVSARGIGPVFRSQYWLVLRG